MFVGTSKNNPKPYSCSDQIQEGCFDLQNPKAYSCCNKFALQFDYIFVLPKKPQFLKK